MKFSKIKEYETPPSIELFNELHLNQHVPCVIRNCLNQLSTSKWNLDYILNKCGHKTVSARLGTNSDSYIKGKAYSLTDIKVSKYINNLKENNETSKNCYLAVQNIKHSLPELQEELEENGIPEYIQKLHSGPFLWIARKDHYEYMHVDPDEGFLMICYGRKRCKLFSYENELNDKLGEIGLEWKFGPAHAGSYGGVWERIIQIVKNSMKATIQNKTLNGVCVSHLENNRSD